MAEGVRSQQFSSVQRKAAQEFLGFRGDTARPLHACESQCTFSTGDRQTIIEDLARPSAILRGNTIEDLQPFASCFAPGSRLRRESSNETVEFERRLCPVDARFVLG